MEHGQVFIDGLNEPIIINKITLKKVLIKKTSSELVFSSLHTTVSWVV